MCMQCCVHCVQSWPYFMYSAKYLKKYLVLVYVILQYLMYIHITVYSIHVTMLMLYLHQKMRGWLNEVWNWVGKLYSPTSYQVTAVQLSCAALSFVRVKFLGVLKSKYNASYITLHFIQLFVLLINEILNQDFSYPSRV